MNKKDKMMELLAIDKNYVDGSGDYLYYLDDDGRKVEVLDLCGSYGVNLLGHKNQIVSGISKELQNFPPNFIQGSKNIQKEKLLSSLQNKIKNHTNKSEWSAELANTGTEIIELALKMCALHYSRKKQQVYQQIYKSEHLHKECQSATDFSEIQAFQCLDAAPGVLHISGSFHGKTLGALSVMSNPAFRKDMPIAFSGLEIKANAEDLLEKIEAASLRFKCFDTKKSVWIEEEWLPIMAIIIEPIQGESGVHVLSKDFLQSLAGISRKYNIPVISDEIQCGLYRTGSFSALDPSDLIADIYCFGKSLGAGIAKVSALTYQKGTFPQEIYTYHSSTFSEDYLGCFAANAFLEHMDNQDLLEKIKSEWLMRELTHFAQLYPEYIKDVRGKGYMTCIELKQEILNQSFITKFFKDIGKLGYWVSSVLLNREQLRVLPTLSAPLCFRIQPSIEFNPDSFKRMARAWVNFFEAVQNQDIEYLFGHLIPVSEGAKLKSLPLSVRDEIFPPNAAVFICHPIDLAHLSDIVDLVEAFEEDDLDQIIDEVREEQKFTIYHTDTLRNIQGDMIDVVFLGIPLTSKSFYKALRDGKRDIWIKKIQDAVDYANANAAKSIGLGQFTSIITNGGLYLRSSRAVLTTGNAYTVRLALEALFQAANESGLSMQTAKVSVVGAAGNIASVIAEFVAATGCSLNLVYRANPFTHMATREHAIKFLQKIWDRQGETPLKSLLSGVAFDDTEQFEQTCNHVNPCCTFSSSIASVFDADIIILSTNDPRQILGSGYVKPGAIIVDISVPPNASSELIERKDITYIKGGVAALPVFEGKEQWLDSVILPFGSGECFACMAETFGLAFSSSVGPHYVGDISAKKVEEIATIMQGCGFGLARLKTENSL